MFLEIDFKDDEYPETLDALRKEFRLPEYRTLFDYLESLHDVNVRVDRSRIILSWLDPSGKLIDYSYQDPWDRTFYKSYELSRIISQVCFEKYPVTDWSVGRGVGTLEINKFRKVKGIKEPVFDRASMFETHEIVCRAIWEICEERYIPFLAQCMELLWMNLPLQRMGNWKEDRDERLRHIVNLASKLIGSFEVKPEDIFSAISEDQVKKVLDA